MNSILLVASIAVLATAASTSSLADGRGSRAADGAAPQAQRSMHASDFRISDTRADRYDSRDHRRDREHPTRARRGSWFDHGMQAVPTGAGAGEPGHGWRYFSDPAACRAVVISPQGEYYYSRGEGLGLVAVTQPKS
ncbi:MAG: hypothetical protein KIT60_08570 [Burkholderiaceae bacterium]|nr:hypothetical protein [Burkholderiaceae bacterium]